MSSTTKAIENIARIQSIFREMQERELNTQDLAVLSTLLNVYPLEFRSIAFEAASMNIALGDLKTTQKLSSWNTFLNEIGSNHSTQIHIGLGWALAQEQLNPCSFLSQFSPMLRYRIVDGYGYYEGVLRRRKSVVNQQQIEADDTTAIAAYNQGLGRSLWYTANAAIDDAQRMIVSFATNRQADLWRGLGIACAYVGGLEADYLQEVLEKTGNAQKDFATGVMMSLISRHNAGAVTPDAAVCCKVICNKTVEEVMEVHSQFMNDIDLTSDDAYSKWIEGLCTA